MKNNLKLDEKRKIVRSFIKTNPNCTYLDIRRDTKIKVERVYKNMGEAYADADVSLSKNLTKRNKNKQMNDVIIFIRNNPGCSVTEIKNKTGVNVPRTFGTILNAYKEANITYPKKEFTSGVRNPYVVERCNRFEKEIVNILSKLGQVKYKVRTSSGIADCTFKYKNKNYVIEIKDFRGRNNITISQVNQLLGYMKSLNIKNGLLICPKEKFPKRKNGRNVYIDDFEIKIISKEDLFGDVVQRSNPYNLASIAASS